MAVSKRTRYEVLLRDNHTCRYCGGTAPDVALTIDHVTPVALGGGDEPSNLVTACRDCNAGKSSASPSANHVAQVAEDSLRWAAAMKQAVAEAANAAEEREIDYGHFLNLWDSIVPGYKRRWLQPAAGWEAQVDAWLSAGLSWTDLEQLIGIAVETPNVANRWRYLSGCARNRITKLQERAQELLARGEV